MSDIFDESIFEQVYPVVKYSNEGVVENAVSALSISLNDTEPTIYLYISAISDWGNSACNVLSTTNDYALSVCGKYE